MLGNLLVLILVLGLAGLFGWLTWRALRAAALWVKIAGGLAGGLVTLALLGIFLAGGRGFLTYHLPAAPPAPELTVSGTPEQLARGEYLFSISCVFCHSATDEANIPSAAPPFSGGFDLAKADGFDFMGNMIAENLTPGGKLGNYSDGELFRSLRHGIDQSGQRLAVMGFLPYSQLSDADLQALVAYLRTLTPVETTRPTGDRLNLIGLVFIGAGLLPAPSAAPDSVSAPAAGATAEYGKYVATFGECLGCHGPDATGTPESMLGPAVPNPRPFTGTLTAEEFIQTMRTGVRPTGTPFTENMPWRNAAAMTDADLGALYVFLTTEP